MFEKRVFKKSGVMQFIEVNHNNYDSVTHEFAIKTSMCDKKVFENSIILVDFDDSRTDNNFEKKYYRVYLSQKQNARGSTLYLHENSVNDCTRKYINEHLETVLFGDTIKLNEFLTEHSELNFENTKIQPFGDDLLLTYINVGDKELKWVE